MPVSWSPEAVRDLEAIRNYIAEDSPRYAALVVVPELGDPWIREVIVDPYRVVYRVRGDTAEVVTVFRATRTFPARIP